MILIAKYLMLAVETLVAIPVLLMRFVMEWVVFNPRLGPLRYVAWAAGLYVAFAVLLVYVVAPVRGTIGGLYLADKIAYDAERWLATAIHDANGHFVGTFDPRLDSAEDVNWTSAPIDLGDYVANPDHKSIAVREVPDGYWSCLSHHEDRYIGTWLNPFGIDLIGVLKIPYSTLERSIAARRLSLGVGGSTLPMQFARVIYKSPPHAGESPFDKLARKVEEWWLAPVIYMTLTRGGDDRPLKEWAANHLWLAQRTGGASLHGIELASQIVFGKEARELSTAEQFVLASAVNKPIILMGGSEKLNAVRLDRWRYITEVRARICAEALIKDPEEQKKVLFELVGLASGPPDPQVKPKLQAALELMAPTQAERARANPISRANTLLSHSRFGLKEELKQEFGRTWRNSARGVTTTIDAGENLRFSGQMSAVLARLDVEQKARISAGFTLDPAKVSDDLDMPDVVVVAANAEGEIVRYYESGQTAPYFGSPFARNRATGFYEREREARMIASTGKVLAAIGIANEMKDTPDSLYLDTRAPARGLETCAHNGSERHGRKAIVAFACSFNEPLIGRAARIGQKRMKRLIDTFGFTMPPRNAGGEGTPPSTAAVLGLISGSPRRVHQMAGVVLASLIGRDGMTVQPPTLVKAIDPMRRDGERGQSPTAAVSGIVPKSVIRRGGRPLLKTLLEAPLCYEAFKTSHGTLKSLAPWCAKRRPGLRLHFAKTGTQVGLDADATVDTWIAGGLQFANGAAYSYVVLTGTGTPTKPWGRALHAAQVAAPVLAVLLADLEAHARHHPRPELLPAQPRTPAVGPGGTATSSTVQRDLSEAERNSAFRGN
ncbi:MAG: transglycosylase domain-containing protein [Hyphomicrobiaceae bacterium]|nr:transglycosylase domain-containing protein [Hyphomicrobiaceae bacterium]